MLVLLFAILGIMAALAALGVGIHRWIQEAQR